ncbi:hypothetical protein PAPHI01_0983 [Pancytospora philotis]|nr:hypothetical protein PAPHI01_0983 [Pancytospora philotis]
MPKDCSKCGEPSHIKINLLGYCNACFEKQLEAKAHKHMMGFPPGSRILLFLSGGPAAAALCSIARAFFSKRGRCTVEEYPSAADDSTIEQNGSGNEGASIQTSSHSPIPRCVLEYSRTHGFDAVFYPRVLESVLSSSLASLCAGDGPAAAENASGSIFSGVRAINPFAGIKGKELAYYVYIKKLRRPAQAQPVPKVELALGRFLSELDSKNGLALFNVLNILKKLGQ